MPSRLRNLTAAALIAALPTAALAAADDAAPGATPTSTPDNLSKKLGQSNGVIHPRDVDPKMDKTAPTTGDQNVIRPPASGGGDAPQAK
jgi:hypothetical protein